MMAKFIYTIAFEIDAPDIMVVMAKLKHIWAHDYDEESFYVNYYAEGFKKLDIDVKEAK